jgi:hypothetical protein
MHPSGTLILQNYDTSELRLWNSNELFTKVNLIKTKVTLTDSDGHL